MSIFNVLSVCGCVFFVVVFYDCFCPDRDLQSRDPTICRAWRLHGGSHPARLVLAGWRLPLSGVSFWLVRASWGGGGGKEEESAGGTVCVFFWRGGGGLCRAGCNADDGVRLYAGAYTNFYDNFSRVLLYCCIVFFTHRGVIVLVLLLKDGDVWLHVFLVWYSVGERGGRGGREGCCGRL